jgi:hypothetical protein
MASKVVIKQAAGSGTYKEVRLHGKSMTVGDDLVLVRTGQPKKRVVSTRAADRARVLVHKVANALQKPGIQKSAVFRGSNSTKIFAYSVDPTDPSRVIRESADGTRRVGRLGPDGKFRVADKAA